MIWIVHIQGIVIERRQGPDDANHNRHGMGVGFEPCLTRQATDQGSVPAPFRFTMVEMDQLLVNHGVALCTMISRRREREPRE